VRLRLADRRVRQLGRQGHSKFTADRPYADPEKAARKIIEVAKAIEPVQDGRIDIEKINEPFLYKERGSPAEYGAGIKLAIEAVGSGCTKAARS
jgi:hypothetical protein